MAAPILLTIPPHDPREQLYRRIENAPKEHAEALLAACDILQGLHDKGLLEIAKGALGSGEKILEILVEAGNTPEAIRGIRNIMVLTKLFAAIDPTLLEALAAAVPSALAEAKTDKPLGLVGIMSKATHADTRRMLTIALKIAESLGKELGSKDPK